MYTYISYEFPYPSVSSSLINITERWRRFAFKCNGFVPSDLMNNFVRKGALTQFSAKRQHWVKQIANNYIRLHKADTIPKWRSLIFII